MNGSENGFASAIFFALMSFGGLLKLDDAVGLAVGAVCALVAAISLRRALIKSAQAAEEDHQRIEIQFQQLRTKIIESAEVGAAEMTSLNDAAQIIQGDLQIIRVRLAELDNLIQISENAKAIRSTIAVLDENSSALNAGLEKILVAIQANDSNSVAEELKKIRAIDESNKVTLQTVMKLLQVVGQMLKNPSYSKDLEKISSLVELLAERVAELNVTKISAQSESAPEGLADFNRQDLSLRKKIAAKLRRK